MVTITTNQNKRECHQEPMRSRPQAWENATTTTHDQFEFGMCLVKKVDQSVRTFQQKQLNGGLFLIIIVCLSCSLFHSSSKIWSPRGFNAVVLLWLTISTAFGLPCQSGKGFVLFFSRYYRPVFDGKSKLLCKHSVLILTLFDWSRKLVPLSQPIRHKTKRRTNCNQVTLVFSHVSYKKVIIKQKEKDK